MANLWADGFGRYGGQRLRMTNGASAASWAQVDNFGGTGPDSTAGFTLSQTTVRTGLWSLKFNAPAGEYYARRIFGGQKNEVFFGYAVHFQALPVTEPVAFSAGHMLLASFRDQANVVQCSLWLGTDGSISAYRDGKITFASGFVGTLLGRSLPVIGTGAFNHIEIYAKIGSASGAIEVRVNEVTVLNLTGINTQVSANAEASQVAFGAYHDPFPNDESAFFADMFANDTVDDGSGCSTWIGDVKSAYHPVNADTAQADFALSAGSVGYNLLDDAPPDDATYIDTSATTARSDFGLTDTPANLSEILTVRPFMRAMKDDAGTALIAPNMLSVASAGTVSDQPVTTAFAYYDSNVPLDPNTGAPWTKTALDAAFEIVERTG